MKALRSLRWKIVFGSLVVQLAVLAILLTSSLNLISQSLNRQADLRMAEISAMLNSAVAPFDGQRRPLGHRIAVRHAAA